MPDVSIFIWHDSRISFKDLELVLVQVIWDEWATNKERVEFYVGWMRGTFVCDKSLSKSLGPHVTHVCGTWYKNKITMSLQLPIPCVFQLEILKIRIVYVTMSKRNVTSLE